MRSFFPLLLLLLFAGNLFAAPPGVESSEALGVAFVEPTGAFDPPTLDQLDAKHEWMERPVLSAMAVLKEKLAKDKKPIRVDKALGLKNESKKANSVIRRSLGRYPDSKDDIDFDATFTRHAASNAKSLNPIMGSSLVEFEIIDLIGFAPFAFDDSFNPFGNADALKSWSVSKDQLCDKIVLRDDLLWSDGKPITAYDIEFSWNTIMDERIPVPAVRSGTDELWGVKAYDERTVVYFHRHALATNVWNINFPILPQHVFKDSIEDDPTLQSSDYHARLESNPVCGGPYKVAKRDRWEVVLERREDWYSVGGMNVRAKPYMKEIRFKTIYDSETALRALKNGELDQMSFNARQWVSQTNDEDFYQRNTKVRGDEWAYSYIGWNNKSKFFNDVRVRQAMSHSLDYDELMNKLRHGLYERSNGIFHPQSWMAPQGDDAPPLYEHDLEKAGKLLDRAGWTDSDGDGIRDKLIDGIVTKFEFEITCSSSSLDVCELLKENLEQIGVICNVRVVDFRDLMRINREHKFDATIGGWGTGADPATSSNLWRTGSGRNYTQYSNSRVDKLYEQGAREFDRQKRSVIYAEIHRQLFNDQPYTWLYFSSGFYGFSKRLRGYHLSPRGPFGYSPGTTSVWIPSKANWPR